MGESPACKSGDWLVNNNGDIYTVDKDVFAETYEKVSEGKYRKTGVIWAKVAESSGSVETKSGRTNYRRGDYIVSNNEDNSDAYAIDATTFQRIYEEK